ncbi:MAG: PH domain-containing protein [Solirubrobacterales bacterium]
MAPKLNPGEQVIFEGHPSWRSIIDFYVKGIIATALIALIVGVVTNFAGDEVDKGLVTIVAVVGVAVTILVGFIKRIATDYVITDRRLHIKKGIVSRTIQETRLVRVQNVNFNQGVLQRMLQIGDVDFDTAAGDDYNFVFAGVAQPEEVVHQVDRATRLAGDDGMGTDHGREPVA